MKRITVRIISVILSILLCISLAGCELLLCAVADDGSRVTNYFSDYIQTKYNAEECRAEAERLFGTRFDIVKVHEPLIGEDLSVYTLKSADIPFEINVFSEREAYISDSVTVLLAHAYCDYYEQMMSFKEDDAKAIAEQLGLQVKRNGQTSYVYINSYDQLENVYEYLHLTNELFDFTVVESEMTNILRDIRNRPILNVYLDRSVFNIPESINNHLVKLYYTINNDTYYYTKEALLPTIQEIYIEKIDSLGLNDNAVTNSIRKNICKPALTQLCINGKPVEAKDCEAYILDPNITFDYNWLMNNYYGDIRICAPAADYESAPSAYGDDRNFKYLVELLGGQYKSYKEVDYTPTSSYYMAEWWVGGNKYGAGALCQEFIPTMSAYSINDEGIDIDHVYSKEMWGLENGYGPEDYYIRLTPKALGTLLGVTIEADYENGTLNLITPDGYFEAEPPSNSDVEQLTERFWVEDITYAGIGKVANHYIIYNADGSVLEERTTEDYTYAALEQITEDVVMMQCHGAGMGEQLTFFDTKNGSISKIYNWAVHAGYPYVVFSPGSTGKIVIENILSGNQSIITEDGYNASPVVTAAMLSADGKQITITYKKPDAVSYFIEVTETFDIVLPE